jgi:hypothetical protein
VPDSHWKGFSQDSTFEAMRERERKLGWPGSWARDEGFVRRGIVGSIKNEMPESVLQAFMEFSRLVLKRLRYL